jgi:RsiW-degrading membrane proteinase PrsW (M82 family)
MPVLLSALIVAVPTYFYASLVRNIDRYEKEPLKYIVAAFLWGAIPAIFLGLILETVFAFPIEAIFGLTTQAGQFINIGILAPIIEEVVKGIAVEMIYLWRRREFDGWIDGIVYGSTVGFGFAYVENVLYLSQTSSMSEWATLFFLRVIVLGFMHGFWTSLTGIGFGVARGLKHDFAKAVSIAVGLALAIIGHMLHNGSLALMETSGGATLCISGVSYLVLIALMLGLNVVGGRQDRDMIKTYLHDEVPDIISPETYEALCSTTRNARDHLKLLPKEQHAVVQLACELALKKSQFDKHADAHNADEVMRLREQLRAMNNK